MCLFNFWVLWNMSTSSVSNKRWFACNAAKVTVLGGAVLVVSLTIGRDQGQWTAQGSTNTATAIPEAYETCWYMLIWFLWMFYITQQYRNHHSWLKCSTFLGLVEIMVPRECQGSKSLLEKFVKPVIEVVTSSDVAPGWGHVGEDKGFKKYLLQLQVLHTEDQNKDLQRYRASKGLKSW